MFEDFKRFEIEFEGRKLVVETGKMAQLANGSCFVRYGDTAVLVVVTASKEPRSGIDFFPLSVDFEEKLYSVGKIPGSFLKREGKPSEKAILTARLIDRCIRPLFSGSSRNDVSVVCTVMSVDEDCSPELTAVIGASIALSISDIPWNGPVCGVSVGLIDEKIIINPDFKQRVLSSMELTVVSASEKVVMIEAGADCIKDEIIFNSIVKAHDSNLKIIKFINKIKQEIGKRKCVFDSIDFDVEMVQDVKSFAKQKLKSSLFCKKKSIRDESVRAICKETVCKFSEIYIGKESEISQILYKLQKEIVRKWLFEDKRVDDRKLDEIRELCAEVGILPRAHGSGIFSRGMTQVLTAVTLGSMRDNQTIDDISEEESKRYMHHYNFPSFSVGETRPSRAPNRREIGHGALAERALEPVIPSVDDFPYTVRLVSEVLSSNGSTSQGAVCGSTLALMDAGVPISEPVAGISCGLVSDGTNWRTFVDIQGIEDFFGDMDFKVAGTRSGITAIQMDLKIDGLTFEILKEALEKTKKARIKILDEVILKTINSPRKELSKYAPKVLVTNVPVNKIREVIGSGGKIVQKICSDFKVKVEIEDEGRVFVMSSDISNCYDAVKFINSIVRDLTPGEIFDGRVTKVTDFGVFVELVPGKEGMCRIPKFFDGKKNQTSIGLKVGDVITVKVIDFDSKGRINLKQVSEVKNFV
ncbi:MAG: polyribonucleotide nucleotidyltransferase [Oscillospiraceae bacterium]|nr:polyribonucleotide nucleotidyltransferase [Oscillospiraceae bacterium]